ncbi:MAG: glycosyltransferase [Phycisphaerales bacterium JB043]
MRIVHCANYHFKKDGAEFANWDLKLDNGFAHNGWYVYPFSVNDRARMLSPTGHKTFGIKRANRALIETCQSVHPDVLVLGHAQNVTRETIMRVRDALPEIRILLWYCDSVTEDADTGHLYERMDALDAMFFSTGGSMIEPFGADSRISAFVPNPVDINIESNRAFECERPEYDVVFFGRDDPRRNPLLESLRASVEGARFGYFGCLGHAGVYGHEREAILARSAMALNLSRWNDVALYSSNRIADVIGNGLLTLTHASSGLQALYPEDEVAYFKDEQDLATRVAHYLGRDDERRTMARRAWEHAHRDHSSTRVARFMIEAVLREDGYRDVTWPMFVFGG